MSQLGRIKPSGKKKEKSLTHFQFYSLNYRQIFRHSKLAPQLKCKNKRANDFQTNYFEKLLQSLTLEKYLDKNPTTGIDIHRINFYVLLYLLAHMKFKGIFK